MLKSIGALWLYQSKKGDPYYSGHIDGKMIDSKNEKQKILAFTNRNKKNKTQPDIKLYLKDDGAYQSSSTAENAKTFVSKASEGQDALDDKDIPF